MSLRWGDEAAVGKGPPGQWERQVVGAALLLFVAALAMTFTARKRERPGTFALVIAALACGGALALAMSLRAAALDNQQPYLLAGGGWTWMTAGACMGVAAVASALALLLRPGDQNSKKGSAAKKKPGKTKR